MATTLRPSTQYATLGAYHRSDGHRERSMMMNRQQLIDDVDGGAGSAGGVFKVRRAESRF